MPPVKQLSMWTVFFHICGKVKERSAMIKLTSRAIRLISKTEVKNVLTYPFITFVSSHDFLHISL